MGDIDDALERAGRETFTREPPKTLKGRINFLMGKLKTTRAVAAELGVSQRSIERYRTGVMRISNFPQGGSSFPSRLLSATGDGAARSWSVRAAPSGQGRLRRRFALGFAHPGQLDSPLDLAGYRAPRGTCGPSCGPVRSP
ncbi:hypothetical protein [Streptomyces sp. NRRL S-448]|uniref:hypothetical protein n=1 Tax=Streptomyces sp. NRRL S-448 TaxID=1463907 RepID=UPI0035615E94